MSYVETPSDAAFSAFLARVDPARVLREMERQFSPLERRRKAFLMQKTAFEREQERQNQIAEAIAMARELRTTEKGTK